MTEILPLLAVLLATITLAFQVFLWLELGRREDRAEARLRDELDRLRESIDQKLHGTLETSLNRSFRTVSERLEQVQAGLGEMRSLAAGVGDLKRVLTNVKTRGVWGEVQLGALLEEILTPAQYARNVATTGTREHVEFAIRLPGREPGQPCWLPVDSKFPVEDYQRLVERDPTTPYFVIARGRDLPLDLILAGSHVDPSVVQRLRKGIADNAAEMTKAILAGEGENVKFKGMTWVPSVRDEDYNYVRKMYRTIGQTQFGEFVGN
jgi:hypothetical protein